MERFGVIGLKVDLDLPKSSLLAFTGISGSGKSTLAFNLLHREGQRQYLELLGMIASWRTPTTSSTWARGRGASAAGWCARVHQQR